MASVKHPSDTIAACFAAAGCEGAAHVAALDGDQSIGFEADRPVVMASTVKPLIAIEAFDQIARGALDPARRFRIEPARATAGGPGITTFRYPIEIALRDLAVLMLAISDNTATDLLTDLIGFDALNRRLAKLELYNTSIVSDLRTMWDDVGKEMGFASYAELLAAQNGARGAAAQARATDRAAIDRCAVIDPARTTRSTARDMTCFLAQVWNDTAAHPEACAMLREAMAGQVARRMEPAVPDGGALAAKSGSLFGRIRNEIGVIGYPDGRAYAFAVFTRAHEPFAGAGLINAAMAEAVRRAIEALR
jgi:beta-lactamase class A